MSSEIAPKEIEYDIEYLAEVLTKKSTRNVLRLVFGEEYTQNYLEFKKRIDSIKDRDDCDLSVISKILQ